MVGLPAMSTAPAFSTRFVGGPTAVEAYHRHEDKLHVVTSTMMDLATYAASFCMIPTDLQALAEEMGVV